MNILTIIFVLHILFTGAMTGLIWFVQRVHYPLLSHIPPEKYAAYHLAHVRHTTVIAGPLMALEGITALILVLMGIRNVAFFISVILLVCIWISTVLWLIPCHKKLMRGFDEHLYRFLLRSNWLRTILWTVRSGLLVCISITYDGISPFSLLSF